jgi:hypothetical protein
LYVDSNILIGHGWPEPRPALHNLLRIAAWWDIAVFFPEPTLLEVERHWCRKVEEALDTLHSAGKKLSKTAHPVSCKPTIAHDPLPEMLKQFRGLTANAIEQFGIQRVTFTGRSSEEIFDYATRYVRPFAPDGEGRGFQDAVIFLSMLDHAMTDRGRASVFVTNDSDFRKLQIREFVADLAQDRLRIADFDMAFNQLVMPYVDETRIKPYRRLSKAAEDLSQTRIADIRTFAATNLTLDMLRTSLGDTARQVIGVDDVSIRRVDLSFPEAPTATAIVDISIKISLICRAIVATDFSVFQVLLGEADAERVAPTEHQKILSAYAIIEARGHIVEGELRDIELCRLAKDEF